MGGCGCCCPWRKREGRRDRQITGDDVSVDQRGSEESEEEEEEDGSWIPREVLLESNIRLLKHIADRLGEEWCRREIVQEEDDCSVPLAVVIDHLSALADWQQLHDDDNDDSDSDIGAPIREQLMEQLMGMYGRSNCKELLHEFSHHSCLSLVLHPRTCPMPTFFIDFFCVCYFISHELLRYMNVATHTIPFLIVNTLTRLLYPLVLASCLFTGPCSCLETQYASPGFRGNWFISDDPIHAVDQVEPEDWSCLGQGAFAKVYKAHIRGKAASGADQNLPVAIKVFSGSLNKQSRLDEFIAMVVVQHPYIVKPIATLNLADSKIGALVMELMDMSLARLLQRLRDGESAPLTDMDEVDLMLQLAQAMRFIHERGYMHRDLRPENVLLKWPEEGQYANPNRFNCFVQVKVADLGISKMVETALNDDQQQWHTYLKGTRYYMAPEVRFGSPNEHHGLPYTQKADVFSFGTTCFAIFSCVEPSPHSPLFGYGNDFYEKHLGSEQWKASVRHRTEEARRGYYNKSSPTAYTKSLMRLIEMCWERDPDSRPTFSEICSWLITIKVQLLSDTGHGSLSRLHIDRASTSDVTAENPEERENVSFRALVYGTAVSVLLFESQEYLTLDHDKLDMQVRAKMIVEAMGLVSIAPSFVVRQQPEWRYLSATNQLLSTNGSLPHQLQRTYMALAEQIFLGRAQDNQGATAPDYEPANPKETLEQILDPRLWDFVSEPTKIIDAHDICKDISSLGMHHFLVWFVLVTINVLVFGKIKESSSWVRDIEMFNASAVEFLETDILKVESLREGAAYFILDKAVVESIYLHLCTSNRRAFAQLVEAFWKESILNLRNRLKYHTSLEYRRPRYDNHSHGIAWEDTRYLYVLAHFVVHCTLTYT